jgi:alanine or glycine:cation symporter, AGCS family
VAVLSFLFGGNGRQVTGGEVVLLRDETLIGQLTSRKTISALHLNHVPAAYLLILLSAFDLQPAVAGVNGGIAAADAPWRQTRILLRRSVHRQCASIAASETVANSAIQGFIQALNVFVNTLRSDVVR